MFVPFFSCILAVYGAAEVEMCRVDEGLSSVTISCDLYFTLYFTRNIYKKKNPKIFLKYILES